MEKAYADALMRLGTTEKAGALVENLVAHLKRRGRMKLLPGILRELKRCELHAKSKDPVLELAHEKDKAAAEHALKEMGIEAPHTKVNHTLLSGWRMKSASAVIDRSGKQALVDLYRNITG